MWKNQSLSAGRKRLGETPGDLLWFREDNLWGEIFTPLLSGSYGRKTALTSPEEIKKTC